ncbi:MAG: hypothetical protein ACKO96_18615, partial [Flammeovirgaceae bacterium]
VMTLNMSVHSFFYTPWPTRVAVAVRVFKATWRDQIGTDPELKQVTVRALLRKNRTSAVRYCMVTEGGNNFG